MRSRSARPARQLPSVVGIDASLTCTGVAFRYQSEVFTTGLKPGTMRGMRRLHYLRTQVMEIVEDVKPQLVVLEDYAQGRNIAAKGKPFHMGELGGVLKLALWEQGFDLLLISPSSMKMAIAGKGNADKDQVIASLSSKFGLHIPRHDEADAAALMFLGERYCGGSSPSHLAIESKRFDSIRSLEIFRGRLKSIATQG